MTLALRKAGMLISVVLPALFSVAEHIICLGDLFKFFLSGFVVRIGVGMILFRQAAVDFFYFVRRGAFFDAEYLVVIFFVRQLSERLGFSAVGGSAFGGDLYFIPAAVSGMPGPGAFVQYRVQRLDILHPTVQKP